MFKSKILIGLSISFLLMGCAMMEDIDTTDTTTVSTATGGAIGAGLGAIVGSQTGDPATGLVVGAAAGAGTGYAIGNVIKGQEEAVRTQDEAIERQERTLHAQRAEIDELRRMNPDTAASRSYPSNAPYPNRADRNYAPAQVAERNLYDMDRSAPNFAAAAAPQVVARSFDSPECQRAETEAQDALRAGDSADKLFHYRRALRLCPDNPALHNSIGEVYSSMGRASDAEFEFKEALRLDPQFSIAQSNLNSLPTTR